MENARTRETETRKFKRKITEEQSFEQKKNVHILINSCWHAFIFHHRNCWFVCVCVLFD